MKPIRCLAIPLLLLTACEKGGQAPPAASSVLAPEDRALLESVLKAEPAADPKEIRELKATAKPGDTITLRGRIMGNVSPFVEGRAAFIVADPSLIAACSDKPGDSCETPWDACCSSPEDKKKAIATVRIVDARGRVLAQPIEGSGGIAKLATVTVSGKVAEGSGGEVLIIDAAAIRAQP
jgi:hypothetical protein